MTEKNEIFQMRNRLLGEKVVRNLKTRNFDAYYCENKEEALNMAASLLETGASVTWGGSMSISEVGLINYVYQHDFKVIDRDTATSPEQRNDLMRQAFLQIIISQALMR